jgi:hypothetical protein
VLVLLLCHMLMAVALLGALSHQAASLFMRSRVSGDYFVARYARVNDFRFSRAIVVLYVGVLLLGSVLYPTYRVDVRIPFEEMGLRWAVGLFEIKEHAAAIGLGILPLYAFVWRSSAGQNYMRDRRMITALLALIVWHDFIVGHILNNIRGVG